MQAAPPLDLVRYATSISPAITPESSAPLPPVRITSFCDLMFSFLPKFPKPMIITLLY